MKVLQSRLFRITFLVLILLELLSFIGWARPEWGSLFTVLILFGILLISMKDLRLGMGIAFVELIIGSHGYLFSFGAGELSLSLRLGIFLCLFVLGIWQALRERELAIAQSSLFRPLLCLGVFVLSAVIVGVARNNGFSNVFFDANAYMYFLLAIPLWQAIRSRGDVMLLLEMGIVGVLVQSAKVFFLEYAFSHKFWWMLQEVYRWVRDTRIGEITIQYDGPFHRIFFQSHLYTIAALILFALAAVLIVHEKGWRNGVLSKKYAAYFSLTVITLASTLISLSRSNWLGIFVTAISVPFILWISEGKWAKKTGLLVVHAAAALCVSIALIAGIVLFPFPRSGGEFDSSLFSKRALTFTGEAGVSSRWQLLPPLLEAVKQHPVIGSGFGQTVTYITEDKRIRAQNPSGEYTTFSLEWGYLELWLKLGLIGLLAYLFVIGVLLRSSYKALRQARMLASEEKLILQGVILGGIAMLVIHAFSPYLNHPLGIGYLLFWGLMVERILAEKSGHVS